MFCFKCGKQLADGSKFCLFCGQPLDAGSAAAPAAPVAPVVAPQPVQPQIPQQPVQQYQQPVQQYQQPMQQYAAPQPVAQPAYNPAGFAPVGQKPKRFDITKPDTIIILASCLFLFISLFLSYYGTNKKRVGVSIATSLIKVTTGWPYVINIVLCLIFLFAGLKIGTFVMSILNTCWMLLVVVINENIIKDAHVEKSITRGPGFYMSIIASVVLLVGGIMILVRRNKEKNAARQQVSYVQI